MEAAVMNDSLLVDKTAASICMRQHYGINLIAVTGHDSKNPEHLSQISFQPGDVLLLQSSSDHLPGILELLVVCLLVIFILAHSWNGCWHLDGFG